MLVSLSVLFTVSFIFLSISVKGVQPVYHILLILKILSPFAFNNIKRLCKWEELISIPAISPIISTTNSFNITAMISDLLSITSIADFISSSDLCGLLLYQCGDLLLDCVLPDYYSFKVHVFLPYRERANFLTGCHVGGLDLLQDQ